MKGLKTVAVIGMVVLMVTVGSAEEKDKKLSNEAEFSFEDTSGNTEVTTLSAQNMLTYIFNKKIQSTWGLGALYGESNGEENAEKYYTEVKGEYSVTPKLFTSITAGWKQDKPSGTDHQYYVGPSLGYKFLTGAKHLFTSEAGVDYVSETYIDGSDDEYTRGRLLAKYEFIISKKTKMTQTTEYLHDFENDEKFTINSETAFTSELNGNLSLKTSYTVNYDNEPASDDDHMALDKTDTDVKITLVVHY